MLKFGVELEVAKLSIQSATDMLRNKRAFSDKINEELNKKVYIIDWFDGWLIKEDGSIRPYGSELVSPIFTWETRGQVFEMVSLLQKLEPNQISHADFMFICRGISQINGKI